MKRFYALTIALFVLITAHANSVIKAVTNNGKWATATTWNLNRIPQDGDTIVIPANLLVSLEHSAILNNVLINVYGTLQLANGKLNLDSLSRVNVFAGGSLYGQANSDQILINTIIKYKGVQGVINGPMYVDNSVSAFTSFSTLPVTFVSFNVAKVNNDVRITWSTSSETNNNHFEIEKSLDGSSWNTIGMAFAAGNSNSVNNYSFTDKNVTGNVVYYRVKQVDNDGRSKYTTVKSVKVTEEVRSNTQIYAGSGKSITVKFDQPKQNVVIKVVNINGQVIMQQSINNAGSIFSVRLNNNENGIYVVQVTDKNNNIEAKKIILN